MKLSNLDRIRLHQQWWNRANDVPLALIYTPLPPAPPIPSLPPRIGLDIDVPPDELVLRKRADAEMQHLAPKETLVTGYVNFATTSNTNTTTTFVTPLCAGGGRSNPRSSDCCVMESPRSAAPCVGAGCT